MGVEEQCRILEADPPRRFAFTCFGSRVLFELAADGDGGTDLVLTNGEVPDEDYEEMLPGLLNVLFPLKAAADLWVDLRNRDPARTWCERYVDQ